MTQSPSPTLVHDAGGRRLALGVVVAVVVGLIGVDGAQCPAAYNCIYLNAIPEQGYTFEWKATQTIYSLPYGEVRMCCVWCVCVCVRACCTCLRCCAKAT
jgi:hypothetical protein